MSKREGIVHGMPEDEYHGGDELSSTGAKLLLRSPARFKYEVLDGHRVHKAAYDLGTAVHTKVLGVGAQPVTCPPELLDSTGGMRTKAAKEWREEQTAAGNPVLSADQLEQVDAMAEAVLAHLEARTLFEREGDAEVSLFDEWLGVKRRGRIDYLPTEGGLIVDLKTTIDASPDGFARLAGKFGYHIQYGHYTHQYEQLTGETRDMLFVTVEKEPPYLVGVHRLNDQYREIGLAYALEAVDEYRKHSQAGHWPGFEGINTLTPPMSVIYDYQDRFESGEITL